MIVVVDLGMGNLGSVPNCCRRVGFEATISTDPDVLERAAKIILPGVGAFDTAMKALRNRGLYDVLRHKVLDKKTPILGICLGMQLLFEGSDEGSEPGLGWLPGRFVKFPGQFDNRRLLVPHIGWNTVAVRNSSRLYSGMPADAEFYFVHSFRLETTQDDIVASTTEYGGDFVSAVERNMILGVQFHPEKSHQFGAQLIRNFLTLN